MKLDTPKWDALFIVCKDCRKRGNGPKDLKAKKLLGTIKAQTRDARPRPRAVLSSCLGLCPRRATAVAYAGSDGGPHVVAVESESQLDDAVSTLSGGRYR